MIDTTFNGLLSATTVAKATENKVTIDAIKKTTERLAKKQVEFIDKFYADFIGKHGYAPMVYFHKEYMNDWENNRFKVVVTPRVYGKTMLANWQLDQLRHKLNTPTWVGVDLGFKEEKKDMCTERTYDYEKENLREKVNHFEQNHLGAQTERFIEMAREGGRSEHLGNRVRELEEKLRCSNDAVRQLNEAVAVRDDEIVKLRRSRDSWESSYYTVNNRYENYKKKHQAKKTTTRRTK